MTHNTSNDDGTISESEITFSETRSKDVGLAINAASNVNDLGKAFPGQPSVAHDSDIDGLKRLAKVMKTRRKGVSSNTSRWCTVIAKLDSNGDVVAPSPISMKSFGEQQEHHAREITPEEIEQTIKDFGEATRRVIEAGFDGVEIHGANHYLIHQFVSPYYNRRNDEWADSMKFPLAVVQEVLQAKQNMQVMTLLLDIVYHQKNKNRQELQWKSLSNWLNFWQNNLLITFIYQQCMYMVKHEKVNTLVKNAYH